MLGREDKKSNDLFFTCSLIDYIARKTKNTRACVVNALGKERLEKIYDLADVYHSDSLDRVSDDFIREAGIGTGEFDNVADCGYTIPSHWDIGKVYKRLIKMAAQAENTPTGQKILLLYLIVLAGYMAVTWVIYLIRYAQTRKRLSLFLEYLNDLDEKEEEEGL